MKSLVKVLIFFLLTEISGHAFSAVEETTEDREFEVRKKYALVIGNSAYETAPVLPNTLNDAADMCAALKASKFETTCKTDISSKREFKDVLYEFTDKINKNSIILFYFAGHGVEVDGVNYLIPTKAAIKTKSDIDDESVQLNYILREFSSRRSELNIFVLDACRDNPFLNPLRDYVPKLGFATQMDIPANSVLAVSTGANQVSLDGKGRNGTFTKHILTALAIQNVPVTEMFRNAMRNTTIDARKMGKAQEPMVTFSYNGKYCLGGCSSDLPEVRKGNGEEEEIRRRREELASLKAAVAEAQAKQLQIESERQTLLDQQAEINRLRENIKEAEARKEATNAERQAFAAKGREADVITKNIKDASEKLTQLENTKNTLLARQAEINELRARIDAQERGITTKAGSRSEINDKEKKSRYAPTVMPTF
jgi:uncharacterized caspase-like protein